MLHFSPCPFIAPPPQPTEIWLVSGIFVVIGLLQIHLSTFLAVWNMEQLCISLSSSHLWHLKITKIMMHLQCGISGAALRLIYEQSVWQKYRGERGQVTFKAIAVLLSCCDQK